MEPKVCVVSDGFTAALPPKLIDRDDAGPTTRGEPGVARSLAVADGWGRRHG